MRHNIYWSVALFLVSTDVFAQIATPTPLPAASSASPDPNTTSYFKVDHDYAFGLQLWAGATHPLSKTIGLSTDVFIADGQLALYKGAAYSWYGEFDIGPAFTFGPLLLTPMVGLGMDWGAHHATLGKWQLYTILNTDKIYAESWVWALMYSTFKEAPLPNGFHTRDWILYKLSGTLSVGPQIELWANMTSKTTLIGYSKNGVVSMPIGGHIDIAYGTGNVLGVFLGYEANKTGRELRDGNAAVGRFTFIHNF